MDYGLWCVRCFAPPQNPVHCEALWNPSNFLQFTPKRAFVFRFFSSLFQMESGGTVLSTNWSDVGKRKVEVNPPDDMEWKKY